MSTLRIAITPGEPAGIGPDLFVALAQSPYSQELVVVGSKALLESRAQQHQIELDIRDFDPKHPPLAGISILDVPLNTPAYAGKLDLKNSAYVVSCIEQATNLCLKKICDAMVTGPVHKGIINDAGIHFTGHTEFISDLCQSLPAVMLLASQRMKVALVTTHIPLADVAKEITHEALEHVISILHESLVRDFAKLTPKIWVAGLNPHAGEGGHLGREELDVIIPVLEKLRKKGFNLVGPKSADTLFQMENVDKADAFVAMYHDQGLPVIKTLDFETSVNISLGLPIIRTSVDHGTALELAGTLKASSGSFAAAIKAAIHMAGNRKQAHA